MYRPFKFLLFILAIQRYRPVDCYAPGSVIWSRNLQKFIPITNVSAFGAYAQEIVAKSRKKETHNFQGKVLKLGYVKDYNMVNFIDNDSKVTGVCGDIWNTLAEYSNFTLAIIKTQDLMGVTGRWRLSTFGMIYKKKIQIVPRVSFSSSYKHLMDFTTPIWRTRYRIYIVPERHSDTNWIFNMFEYKVWFAILLFYLLLSVLGYLVQKISTKVFGDKRRHHNLHDYLFYTFSTLCSQGFIPDTLDRRSKIFGISKRIFAWLLLIVLSSHVISHMTTARMQPPFEDIESLVNKTDRNIITYTHSIAADQYWMAANNLWKNGVFKGNRMFFTNWQKRMHKTVCRHENRTLALFELEDTKQAFGNRYCEMVAVGKSYFPTWVAFGISKGFKYKRTFDIGILKMREFGLIDRLRNRWLKTSAETNSENLGHASFTPVNLDQVLMLFVILGIGIVASAIIFVLEVIVFIYKSNQHRPVRGKAALNARRLPTENCEKNRAHEIELPDGRRIPVYVQNIVVTRPRRTFYN